MPSDAPPKTGVFTPTDIFAVAGVPALMGTLKSGLLQKDMAADIDGLHLIITKVEGAAGAISGISVSGLDITQAQNLVGKDLHFSEV